VSLHAVSPAESALVHLVAVCESGVRLYFSTLPHAKFHALASSAGPGFAAQLVFAASAPPTTEVGAMGGVWNPTELVGAPFGAPASAAAATTKSDVGACLSLVYIRCPPAPELTGAARSVSAAGAASGVRTGSDALALRQLVEAANSDAGVEPARSEALLPSGVAAGAAPVPVRAAGYADGAALFGFDAECPAAAPAASASSTLFVACHDALTRTTGGRGVAQQQFCESVQRHTLQGRVVAVAEVSPPPSLALDSALSAAGLFTLPDGTTRPLPSAAVVQAVRRGEGLRLLDGLQEQLARLYGGAETDEGAGSVDLAHLASVGTATASQMAGSKRPRAASGPGSAAAGFGVTNTATASRLDNTGPVPLPPLLSAPADDIAGAVGAEQMQLTALGFPLRFQQLVRRRLWEGAKAPGVPTSMDPLSVFVRALEEVLTLRFVVLTTAGVYTLCKLRPIDQIASLLESAPQGAPMPASVEAAYGRSTLAHAQGTAGSSASGPTHSVLSELLSLFRSRMSRLAPSAGGPAGGEERHLEALAALVALACGVQPTALDAIPSMGVPQPVTRVKGPGDLQGIVRIAGFTNSLSALSRKADDELIAISGNPLFNATSADSLVYSPRYAAILQYVSRILTPVWNASCFVVAPDAPTAASSGAAASQDSLLQRLPLPRFTTAEMAALYGRLVGVLALMGRHFPYLGTSSPQLLDNYFAHTAQRFGIPVKAGTGATGGVLSTGDPNQATKMEVAHVICTFRLIIRVAHAAALLAGLADPSHELAQVMAFVAQEKPIPGYDDDSAANAAGLLGSPASMRQTISTIKLSDLVCTENGQLLADYIISRVLHALRACGGRPSAAGLGMPGSGSNTAASMDPAAGFAEFLRLASPTYFSEANHFMFISQNIVDRFVPAAKTRAAKRQLLQESVQACVRSVWSMDAAAVHETLPMLRPTAMSRNDGANVGLNPLLGIPMSLLDPACAAPKYSLTRCVAEYVNAGYFEGAIEVSLASALHVAALSLQATVDGKRVLTAARTAVRDGFPEDADTVAAVVASLNPSVVTTRSMAAELRSHTALRLRCYHLALATLSVVLKGLNAATRAGLLPGSTSGDVGDCTEFIDAEQEEAPVQLGAAVDAKATFRRLLTDALRSRDRFFHDTLYRWLISQGLIGLLVRVQSPYIESFLSTRAVNPDYLSTYYELRSNYAQSARLQARLAIDGEEGAPTEALAVRISRLRRAFTAAGRRVAQMTEAVTQAELSTWRKELGLLEAQKEVMDALQLKAKALREGRGSVAEAERLASAAADLERAQVVPEALMETAKQHQLFEPLLAILDRIGTPTLTPLRNAVWVRLLEDAVAGAVEGSAADPKVNVAAAQAAVSALITRAGKRFLCPIPGGTVAESSALLAATGRGSPEGVFSFPTKIVLGMAEELSMRQGSNALSWAEQTAEQQAAASAAPWGWLAVDVMSRIPVPWSARFEAYRQLLDAAVGIRPIATAARQYEHLLLVLASLLSAWAEDAALSMSLAASGALPGADVGSDSGLSDHGQGPEWKIITALAEEVISVLRECRLRYAAFGADQTRSAFRYDNTMEKLDRAERRFQAVAREAAAF
jgi:hypothetical protein